MSEQSRFFTTENLENYSKERQIRDAERGKKRINAIKARESLPDHIREEYNELTRKQSSMSEQQWEGSKEQKRLVKLIELMN